MSVVNDFDIVIIGGAMTGSTLALALANSTLRVAVVEASELSSEQPHPGFDARAIALAQGSVEQLKTLGIWPAVAHLGEPIKRIEVSDQGHAGATEMQASDYGLDHLGMVVELESMGRALQQALNQTDVQRYQPDSVVHLSQHDEHVALTLASGAKLTAKLVVAADGTFSRTCDAVGLERSVTPFEQRAIIANIETQTHHQQRAFERFTPHGPVALLPMRAERGGNSRMSLVLCVNEHDASEVTSLGDEAFIDYLQREFGWRLGRITKVGARSSYPLALHQRRSTTHHRVVALGNAAQTLHPIAGQGFNLGLRDVTSLYQVIQNSAIALGSAQQLLEYRRARQRDVALTCNLTETMVRGFSNRSMPLVASRNMGLMAMDWLMFVKQPFVEHTLGWSKA